MRQLLVLKTLRATATRFLVATASHPIPSGIIALLLGSAIGIWAGVVPGPTPGGGGDPTVVALTETEYVRQLQAIERDGCQAEARFLGDTVQAFRAAFALRANEGAPPLDAGEGMIDAVVGNAMPSLVERMDSLVVRAEALVPPEKWHADHTEYLGARRARRDAVHELNEAMRDTAVGAPGALGVDDVLEPLGAGLERLDISPEFEELLDVSTCRELDATADAATEETSALLQLVFVDPFFGLDADATGAPIGETYGHGALLPACAGDTLYAWTASLLPPETEVVASWGVEDPETLAVTWLIGGLLGADGGLGMFVAPVTVPADFGTLVFRLEVGFDYLEWVVFTECF